MSTLHLRTKAWFGDKELELEIPDSWEVATLAPVDSREISDQTLVETLCNTFDTPPLSKIARGRANALIVVDDLTRPTPSSRIIPHILHILIRAGIDPSKISFLVATGAHRPMTKEETEKKLGKEIVVRFPVVNHNPFSSDLQHRGMLSSGMPVIVNKFVVDADLVIGLSSVIPHSSTGFSGGGKLLLPGASGFLSIAHLHSFERRRFRGSTERTGTEPDIRNTIEAFAQRVGLDFSINIVVNSKREIAGMFCGCPVRAYREATFFARNIYRTYISRNLLNNSDILLLNAYPLDTDASQTSKSLWPKALFPHLQYILINSASAGIAYHGWNEFKYASLFNLLWGAVGVMSRHKQCPRVISRVICSQALRAVGNWYFCHALSRGEPSYEWFLGQGKARYKKTLAAKIVADKSAIKICSGAYPEKIMSQRFPRGALFPNWEQLHRSGLFKQIRRRVIVFPCAPLQLPVFSK